ncbi:MAG: NAD-dependent epimerase/dehydratase family protein [Thermoanaerobaculia bacterium]
MRLPSRDLEEVTHRMAVDWEQLRGQQIFVTGGSGFIGRWIVESFWAANSAHRLRSRMFVLTRDPSSFADGAPHIAADNAITIIRGDLGNPGFKDSDFSDRCDFVIHAATASSAELARGDSRKFAETIEGTRRVLDLAVAHGARRFLYLSSGAVYGPQPASVPLLAEDFEGGSAPLDPGSQYAQAKRAGEALCSDYATREGLGTVIARGFAFIGPNLPLGGKFAAGSFLSDLLEGAPIRVHGDGTAVRSFLYAGDLAAWLWTLLLRGAPGRAYNVGSERAVSIGELAGETASLARPPLRVEISGTPDPSRPPERYVPSTARAREELGLFETVNRLESLRRTFDWHRNAGDAAGLRVAG